MTDASADGVVEAAEEADPEDAKHEDADESDQPDASTLPQPDGLPEPDEQPDPEDVEEDEEDADAESDGETSTETATHRATGDTMGDLYAKMLVNLTNAMIEQHGKPDADPVDVEAARQADLDHHFNRLMDSMGMGRDLPPGQAVVLSTTMFVGGNLAAKTDVPQKALEDVNLDL